MSNYAHTSIALWDMKSASDLIAAAHQQEEELETDYKIELQSQKIVPLCKGRALKVLTNLGESELVV